jgi:hypothetical protein
VWRGAGLRVVFPGYGFGRGFRAASALRLPLFAPAEVGGTHRVILEAMAAGNCVLVHDHQPNAETVRDAAPGAAVYKESGPGPLPDSLFDRERMVLA